MVINDKIKAFNYGVFNKKQQVRRICDLAIPISTALNLLWLKDKS